MKRTYFLFIVLALVIGGVASKRYWRPLLRTRSGEKTVADRVMEFGATAKARILPHFDRARIQYPPARLVLVGIKNKQILQVYGSNADGPMHFIRSYPILRTSGHLGPKLKDGDLQVPEGLYKIELLNPNSNFHVSLRISYPNEFDCEQAAHESRTNLGGDIMIHGGAASVGCLAMGDEAAEDLFILAEATGLRHIDVILTPTDFRREKMPTATNGPAWIAGLYGKIAERLSELPLPN